MAEGVSSDNFIIENTGRTYKIYISNEDNGIEQRGYLVDSTVIYTTKGTPYVIVEEDEYGGVEKAELYVPENFVIHTVAE